MSRRPLFIPCCVPLLLLSITFSLRSQQTPATTGTKPTEHVLGTLTAVDPGAHTVTVKEDGSAALHVVQVGETRTLLKVAPGAKDIKGATRITADQLSVGDRVDVRGFKVEADPTAINARSVILMSGSDVQQAREKDSAAWQHASTAIVTSVDASSGKLAVNLRSPEGPKPITLDASGAQFTRFSPEAPQTPAASQIADVQVGDQVRFLPPVTAETATEPLHVQKLYSGSFKTAVGTIVSVDPSGKSLVVKDLQTKKPVNINLRDDSALRRLPPPMANMLARRFNPSFKSPAGEGSASGVGPAGGPPAGLPPNPNGPTPNGQAPPHGQMPPRAAGNGDLSQMLERIPRISASELKPGDAVIISGSPVSTTDPTLVAHAVIAGVEPIFQSATPRQAQSLGDWGAALGGGIPAGEGGPQ